MKPPRAAARGTLHLFGGIRRSTRLRSVSFGGSTKRIHPWAYAYGRRRRWITPVPQTFSPGLASPRGVTYRSRLLSSVVDNTPQDGVNPRSRPLSSVVDYTPQGN